MGNEFSDFIGDYRRFSMWTIAVGAIVACVAVGFIFYHVTLNDFARSIQAGMGNLTSDALRDGVSKDNVEGVERVGDLAGPLIAGKGFVSITVYDANGEPVFSAPNSAPPAQSALEREMLDKALAGEATGRPVFGDGGVFHIVVPLKSADGGAPPGALSGRRPLKMFLQGTAQTIGLLVLSILLASGAVLAMNWAFARRASRAMERSAAVASALQLRLKDSLQEAELQAVGTLQALTAAVDAKDVYTSQHSLNVADYACAIAHEIGRDDLALEVERAGLLHDIGKIGVAEALLQKPSKLTKTEMAAVAQHSRLGANIIQTIPFLMSIVPAVAHHHERWDGTGYPDGLAGEAIPLQARILATADAFDAMTTTRPYRPAMPTAEAKRELTRCRGEQFDPSMVDALLRVLDSGRVVVHPQSTKAAS